MIFISMDIEADGPCPGLYSMVSFGAVAVEPSLNRTYFGELAPITDAYIPEALAVSGVTREDHKLFSDPEKVMLDFREWLNNLGDKPAFISDNNGFDWQFINYYFHRFCGSNPFGFSSQNLGSLYKGKVCNIKKNFKHLRDTKHTHNPVDDAMGNAEAILKLDIKGLY